VYKGKRQGQKGGELLPAWVQLWRPVQQLIRARAKPWCLLVAQTPQKLHVARLSCCRACNFFASFNLKKRRRDSVNDNLSPSRHTTQSCRRLEPVISSRGLILQKRPLTMTDRLHGNLSPSPMSDSRP
jgi:hypothetical protein